MNAELIILDLSSFRKAFPAFRDAEAFPDELVERHFDAACVHVSPRDRGRSGTFREPLQGRDRRRALNLMTAHLLHLEQLILSGGVGGVVQSAGIDKVSVSLVPPPVKSQFAWWLNQSPYGQELHVLLKGKAAGGAYIGGSPERAAFRKAGGGFGG